MAWGPYNDNLYNRSTNHFQVRARGYITADAREQTAYGTARGYIAVGTNNSDIGTGASENAFSSNRAFVQWAGITAGLSQSFFDFYSAASALYRAGYLPSQDTGDGGWWVWGYTAQLGNGMSFTVSAEERRMNQIINQVGFTTGAFVAGNLGAGSLSAPNVAGTGYGGWQVPDIVANLRTDQTWGSAQIMGAAHEINPLYYGPASATAGLGHPGDTWGWAAGAGLRLNFPSIAQGDYFQAEANYLRGRDTLQQPRREHQLQRTGRRTASLWRDG